MENLASVFRPALDRALELALARLNGLSSAPVAPTADLATLRARLHRELADEGLPAEQVIAELARDVAGGRFFAGVIGGALAAALAADWLTSAWDQNAGISASGPAAAVVEEVAGAWLKEIFGLPGSASFAFLTGCQMAHVTCLAAVRHRLLARPRLGRGRARPCGRSAQSTRFSRAASRTSAESLGGAAAPCA